MQKYNACHNYIKHRLSNDIQEAFLAGWNAAIRYEQDNTAWTRLVPEVDRQGGAFEQYDIDSANKW